MIRTEFLRPSLPGAARRQCAAPAALPDRDLAAREVAARWGSDRAALAVCEQRRAAAVAAVDAAGSDDAKEASQ